MNDRLVPWLATILAISACTSALVLHWPHRESVVTEDLNHDGRPDVWCVYDVENHLTEVFRDTNHDGRRDIREYYDQGALVRRESDRDFNNQIDLVEDFDAATGERSRSVMDLDSDGRADLLVLFRGTDVVFIKSAAPSPNSAAHQASNARLRARDELVPFDDPFGADLTLRPAHVPVRTREFVGLATAGGVPGAQRTSLDVPRADSCPPAWWMFYALVIDREPGSPRGPPPLLRPPNHCLSRRSRQAKADIS
jgi:hypothetical protein